MSPYGKCMGFPLNFPQYGKMQQNPWYGGKSGKLILILFRQDRCFFQLDSYLMVYFSVWEMHEFSHKFPTLRENITKPMVWKKSGKLIVILFPQYGCFFPIRFPSYSILRHMGNAWVSQSVSHSTKMRRTWEIGAHTFPILWVLFFHQIPILW